MELFQFVVPEDSSAAFEELVQHAEAILQRLELHYRVVALCTANLPFAAAKTVDLEVWMPGQGRYVEISSISTCETFQARRTNIKYLPAKSGRAEYMQYAERVGTGGWPDHGGYSRVVSAGRWLYRYAKSPTPIYGYLITVVIA